MELLTIFTATVGFIGAFYLLSITIDHFGKGIYHSGNQHEKRQDWYCFFQPSDLLGKIPTIKKNMDQEEKGIATAEQRKKRRQQQAKRPRLQA